MKYRLTFSPVVITGIAMGVLAAILQVYCHVYPPVAYGICMIGHPMDLINWIANNLIGTDWAIPKSFVVIPAMTAIGVLIGSFIAAYRNKELKWRLGPVRDKSSAFILGFFVVNFGLLWGSCPIRTAVFASYGSITAMLVLASIAVGVLMALAYLRLKVKR